MMDTIMTMLFAGSVGAALIIWAASGSRRRIAALEREVDGSDADLAIALDRARELKAQLGRAVTQRERPRTNGDAANEHYDARRRAEVERDSWKILADELVEVRQLVGLTTGTNNYWTTIELVHQCLDKMRAERQELLAMLRSLEWAGIDDITCPQCGHASPQWGGDGHLEDCPLDALLRKYGEPS